ncbi:uridine kinase [bacterium]|jgi:uridine kinase|nr:uridine kinase [bacterium]
MLVTASTKPSKPFVLGIAGGSGSGKTYFARALQQALGDSASIIYQDNFYIDQSHRFDHDGGAVNFDHPDSLDFPLLASCLRTLKEGKPARLPIYDFVTHTRSEETLEALPTPVIIVDGILIFHPEEVRSCFDQMIFFDTPEALRFERRLRRDVSERGRTPEGVRNQFLKQVKPMHDEFVDPTSIHAQKVVRDLGEYDGILKETLALCRKFLAG